MASATQDMPPPGGYKPINYARVLHERKVKNWMLLTGFSIATMMGVMKIHSMKRSNKYETVEKHDALIALEPFLYAEKDRMLLKQLQINRAEERELMKNHPYWQVGTLYGEKVFKTLPEDAIPPLNLYEMYAHRPHMDVWETNYIDRKL